MGSTKSILMVGGPKHGERMAVREGHSVTIAMPSRDYIYGGSVTAYDMTFSQTVYTREKVGLSHDGRGRTLPIMRHESLSRQTAADAALDILFTEAGGTVY